MISLLTRWYIMIADSSISSIQGFKNIEYFRNLKEQNSNNFYEKSTTIGGNNNNTEDRASISAQGMELYKNNTLNNTVDTPINDKNKEDSKTENESGDLDEKEKEEVKKLKERDKEVKEHEQAHIAAGAGLSIGPPKYEYTVGPDGKRYVTDGEVSINIKKGKRVFLVLVFLFCFYVGIGLKEVRN